MIDKMRTKVAIALLIVAVLLSAPAIAQPVEIDLLQSFAEETYLRATWEPLFAELTLEKIGAEHQFTGLNLGATGELLGGPCYLGAFVELTRWEDDELQDELHLGNPGLLLGAKLEGGFFHGKGEITVTIGDWLDPTTWSIAPRVGVGFSLDFGKPEA